MTALRAFLIRRHMMAMFVTAFALAIKAVVPTGYMIGNKAGAQSLTVLLCASQTVGSVRIQIPVDAGSTGSGHDDNGGSKARDSICGFAGLSLASLGGADVALLAAALQHIIILGFAPVVMPVLQGFFHLRPPLRGPPSHF